MTKKTQSQSFREFGYDSTHLLLALSDPKIEHPMPYVPPVCEIQLRTILQDAWAEVEHELIYKSDWPIPTYQIRRKLAALNANLTLGDIIFQELREFQRKILWKQSKRRSLADESLGLLSKDDIHTKILDNNNSETGHDNLEKIIIDALNAHSEESFESAIVLYTRALQMPGVESVRSILHNHRGMAYLALGNIDESHSDFLASIEFNPSNHRAWYNLGIVLKSLQKLSNAQNAFERCLRLNPAFTGARVKQIHLLLEMGDRQKAKEEMLKLKQQSPDTLELAELEQAFTDNGKPPQNR